MFSDLLKSQLKSETKKKLKKAFPKIYERSLRKRILNTYKLRKFYNKSDDSLHLGKTVLPVKLFCNSNLIGIFESEFADIIYPFLPDDFNMNHSYDEGPYILGQCKVNKGDVVFDCGANIGLFSAMLADYECICYAFEPMPANISYLEKIISLNPHILLAPYAVGDTEGSIQFVNTEYCSTETKIASDKNEFDNAEKITVNSITLDSFVNKNNIKKVDFIKSDIEGAERLLLKGAQGILKEFKPKLSISSYHLPDDPEVLRELILEANSNYIIEEHYKKMYAHVPE